MENKGQLWFFSFYYLRKWGTEQGMLQICVLYHKTYVPPLTYLFNLSLSTNEIPSIWKTAYVRSLFKEGDPTVLYKYMPISKLSILSNVLESLVNDQLKEFLSSKNALSEYVGWFVNYLSDRSQCINIEGLTSSTRNVKIGIPQGSVLF